MNHSDPPEASPDSLALEARFRRTPFQAPPDDLRALCLGAGSMARQGRTTSTSLEGLLGRLRDGFWPYRLAWGAIGMAWVVAFGFWIASISLVPISEASVVAGVSKETERIAVEQRAELMVFLEAEIGAAPRVADRPKSRPSNRAPTAPRSALELPSFRV